MQIIFTFLYDVVYDCLTIEDRTNKIIISQIPGSGSLFRIVKLQIF